MPKKPELKERPLLLPGFPVEFVSSTGKSLRGVLVEEDALYEAWHVRLSEKTRFPALGDAVFVDLVSVMTYDFRPAKNPIIPVKIVLAEWDCPKCGACNCIKAGVLSVMSLRCHTCQQSVEGVMTDSNHDILKEGQPFPE